MALTNGEANAFGVVARYFLGVPGHAGPVSDERALNALLLLREKAFKTLMAGLHEDELREAFATFLAAREPNTLDGAMYLLARADTWQNVTVALPAGGREAMADAALRYEAQAIDDGEDRLDPRCVRWWR